VFRRLFRKFIAFLGFTGPSRYDVARRGEYNRQCARRSYTISVAFHAAIIFGPMLYSLLVLRGCLHAVPIGVPMGKGDQVTAGRVVIHTPQRVRRKRRVRQSPVSVYEMLKDEEQDMDKQTAQQFSDNVGVPGGVGKGAAAAGSPHGTVLGGKLYFYRIKFKGPDWDANSAGVRPLMQEVLKAGVVKKVSGFNNVVTLKDLTRHKDQYMPALLYMTGTGEINATDEEVKNLRDYLNGGGMLFADVSGGNFHDHFIQFMRRVFPGEQLTEIEFDHEIYRGKAMPYAMPRGCPVYRRHRGAGPALGLWKHGRLAVFYSRGDLGAAWAAAGIFQQRRRDVEQAYRMGVNIIAYSLLYYKYTGSE
jgi:hypothetical protein